MNDSTKATQQVPGQHLDQSSVLGSTPQCTCGCIHGPTCRNLQRQRDLQELREGIQEVLFSDRKAPERVLREAHQQLAKLSEGFEGIDPAAVNDGDQVLLQRKSSLKDKATELFGRHRRSVATGH